jgi:hypothetical protein
MSKVTMVDTAGDFHVWVRQAKKGDTALYLIGSHAPRECEPCKTAREAFDRKLVHLVQKRVGECRFHYLAIAR